MYLNKYCGCFTLRIGSYCAAVLTILVAVTGIVLIAVMGDAMLEEDMEEMIHGSEANRKMILNVAIITTVVLLAIWLLSGIFLLVGIMKGSHPMMTFWVVVTVVFLSVSLFGFLNTIFCFDPTKAGAALQNLVMTAVQLGYLAYMLLVVVSYKYSLKASPPAYEPEWSHPQPEWSNPKEFFEPTDAKV